MIDPLFFSGTWYRKEFKEETCVFETLKQLVPGLRLSGGPADHYVEYPKVEARIGPIKREETLFC